MDFSKLWNLNRVWWLKKSPFEKKLIATLTVSLIVIISLMIYVNERFNDTAVCSTPTCILAANQILSYIDSNVDPCDDFFKFACGKYIQQPHGYTKLTPVKELRVLVNQQLVDIIQQPIKATDHYMVKVQYALIQNCMNENLGEENLRTLKDTITELKGWPVVEGKKWDERWFNWTNAIFKLREIGYEVPQFFSVEAVEDPMNLRTYTVKINLEHVKDVRNEHKELYRNFMTEVAVLFGANRKRALIEMSDVLQFTEGLSKITEFNRDGATTRVSYQRIKVREFQNHSNEINWLKFINTILQPASKISSDSYAIFPEFKRVAAVFQLLNATPRRVQANYISWTIIKQFLVLFPKQFQLLEKQYMCATDTLVVHDRRLEFCKKVLYNSFRLMPAYITYARKYLSPEKKNKVGQLVQTIKWEILDMLTKTFWMDEETRKRLQQRVTTVVEVIGTGDDYLDDNVYEKFNFVKNENTSNFFKSVLNLMKYRTDGLFLKVGKSVQDSALEIFYQAITEVNALYWEEHNTMIIPVGILQGIFYSASQPNYLNSGALGAIIGHELIHSIIQPRSSIWSNTTHHNFEERLNGFATELKRFNKGKRFEVDASVNLEEFIADSIGIKSAYRSYQRVQNNKDLGKLVGIELTPEKLFWVSSITRHCYKPSKNLLERFFDNNHERNSFWVNALLRNNFNFAEDFGCSVGSKMNPALKCQLF